MDENIILKYRREFDCWLCNECDTENENSRNNCLVCNTPKPPHSTILKAWSPADEAPPATPPRTPPHQKNISINSPDRLSSSYMDKPRDGYNPPVEPGNMSSILIWLIVFIIIFAALIIYGIYG